MRVIKYLVLPQLGLYFIWFHTEFAVVIIKFRKITEKNTLILIEVWGYYKRQVRNLVAHIEGGT
jgi:hypothetical protein